MTKSEFIEQLRRMLPSEERDEIVADFEEHFTTGFSQGKSEEDIIRDLGDPIDIAKEYGYNPSTIVIKKEVQKSRMDSRIFGFISLLLFDAIIGIAIISSIFAVWISLWAVVLSLFVIGIALILSSFIVVFFFPLPWYIALVSGISLIGLSGLFTVAMVYISKYCFKGFAWYIKLHVNMLKGE